MHDLFALLYFRWLVFKELNVMWKKTYSVVKHFIGVYRNLFSRELSQYLYYIFFMLNCFTTKCTCCINIIVTEIEIFLHSENMIWYFERKPDEGYSRNSPCALNLVSTFSIWDRNNLFEGRSPIMFGGRHVWEGNVLFFSSTCFNFFLNSLGVQSKVLVSVSKLLGRTVAGTGFSWIQSSAKTIRHLRFFTI